MSLLPFPQRISIIVLPERSISGRKNNTLANSFIALKHKLDWQPYYNNPLSEKI
jgi:hypothetical protein